MSTNHSIFSSHIISVLCAGWGHIKPFIALASKIVQTRSDIVITICIISRFEAKFEKEVDRYFRAEHESLRSNIRLIAIDDEAFRKPPFHPEHIMHDFESFYRKLTSCQPVMSPTGQKYSPTIAPTLAFVDMILPDAARAIRDIGGKNIPIMGWTPANLSYCMRLVGPQELGGYGDLKIQMDALATETGKPTAEIEDEVYFPDSVVSIPGLPLTYGYEYFTQEYADVAEVVKIPWNIMTQQLMTLCDGVVSTSSIAYEAENIDAWRNWLSQTNRKFYVVGPVPLPPPTTKDELESRETIESMESNSEHNIVSFLDDVLERYGRGSLFHVSFGSTWWPKDEYVFILLDILLECKIPFILTHASVRASIPSGISAKIQGSGLGLLEPWGPQQLILKHPATGWFVTHCGHNSIMEALREGIPMIAWPLAADQLPGAARLSVILDVAFELLEVRTGKHSNKPLYRGGVRIGTVEALADEMRGVFRDARGPIGERKRKNVHRIRDAMKRAWDDGGDAHRELNNLLTDLI